MPLIIKYKNGYRVNFRFNGERHQKRFSNKSYNNPEREAQNYIKAVISGNMSDEPVKKNIEEQIRSYISWSENIKRKSFKTIRGDNQRLRVFLTFTSLNKIYQVKNINVNHIREFQEYYFKNYPFTDKPSHRRSGANPAATWEKYRQVVSAFLNWCLDRKLINNNPLSKAKEFIIKTQNRLPEIFNTDELKKLFEYFDTLNSKHISAFYRLLAYTGVRLGEAINLKWDDIDFYNNTIEIKETKNFESRLIPISNELLPYLKELPNKTIYIFDNGSGKPLYHSSWYFKLLNQATLSCSIKPKNIHTFRHTFCSMLMDAGVNIKTVAYLAGHKRIETTLIYTHFCKESKQKAINKLNFSTPVSTDVSTGD